MEKLKSTLHIGSHDRFDPDEQASWRESQKKLREAAKVSHIGQLKFQQADEHLSHAENAKRQAEEAAQRQAEVEQEAQRHLQTVEQFKAKHPELQNAHHEAARTAQEKAAAAAAAERELQEAENMRRQKSQALAEVLPHKDHAASHHRSLEEKLAEHQRLTNEKEQAHRQREAELLALRNEHDGHLAEVDHLEKSHNPLTKELAALEAQLAALRERHAHSERGLHAARERAHHSHARLQKHNPTEHEKALAALQAHKQGEAELAAEVANAKELAHQHQHRHELAMAEREKAREHHERVRGQVSPIMKEVEEARLAQEAAERHLAESEAQARHSHATYRGLMGDAQTHGKKAAELQAIADKHKQGYLNARREGDDALARKEKLWEEAKNHGDTGLSHFKEKVSSLEERLDHIGDKIKDAVHGDNTHTSDGAARHANGQAPSKSNGLTRSEDAAAPSYAGATNTNGASRANEAVPSSGASPVSDGPASNGREAVNEPTSARTSASGGVPEGNVTPRGTKKTGLSGLFSRK